MQYRVLLATTNTSFTPSVQDVNISYNTNNAPALASIADQVAVEGTALQFSVTASDADSDNLTYTTTHGTITKFTNTIADFSWTPQGANVGITNVTITVSDGVLQAQETFAVNTTASNKVPSIRSIADMTYYYAQRVIFDITVDDQNQNENLTFSSSPSLPIVQISDSNVSTIYVARVNFSAFDDDKGSTLYTVGVRDDDGASDTENFTITVNYCGDGVCQSQESAATCAEDCATTEELRESYISVDFPDRICVNETINITAYNASSRYVCFLDGQTNDDAAAWCDELEGVDFQFYGITGSALTDLGTASTNSQGLATFIARNTGRYKLVASATDYTGTEEIFTASICAADINSQQTIIRAEAPQVELLPEVQRPPRTEQPELTPENVSILSIIIFYMIVPLLLAALTYVSTEYYSLHKDTDPRLLAMRIKLQELQARYWPRIEPYWMKIYVKLDPLGKKLDQILWIPLGRRLIPLWNKLTKR